MIAIASDVQARSVIASFLRVESTETGVSVGVEQLKTLANSTPFDKGIFNQYPLDLSK